ncbi:MAG: haloacid dehalogenase-like hydrolase [bacterium]
MVHICRWYALNVPTLTGRLQRGARLAAARTVLRGGRSRGSQVLQRHLLPQLPRHRRRPPLRPRRRALRQGHQGKVFQDMLELMKRSRAEGYAQVLVTGALDTIVAPLARYLEVDHWFANKLEIIDGEVPASWCPRSWRVPEGRDAPPLRAGTTISTPAAPTPTPPRTSRC